MSTPLKPACSQDHCHVPSGMCAYGELDYRADCKFFSRNGESAIGIAATGSVTEFPWTGSVLGLDDLEWLAARGRPRIFAPIGSYNAGKTTFLAANYLGLCHGAEFDLHRFAGSLTLGGWENLAGYMRYAPEGTGPQFPPHTANTAQRLPGLLHLALRRSDGLLVDAILGDAPGEWFNKWAAHVAHEEAAGARWIAQHADGFILFVDSEELAGANRGAARDDLFKLAQRLAEYCAERPVAIVWSKADLIVRPAIREQVDMRLKQLLPDGRIFSVTVRQPGPASDAAQRYIDVMSWLLNHRVEQPSLSQLTVRQRDNPFLAYRGVGS